MFKGLNGLQIITAVVIVVVAIVGWVTVYNNQGQLEELRESLALVSTERAAATDEIAELKTEIETLTEATARLEEAEQALDEYKTAVGSLEGVNREIEDRNATLASMTPELDARSAELEELTAKVEALEVQALVFEAFTGGGPLRFQTSRSVNVRSEPSTDSEVLVVLPEGANVEVFEAVAGGEWYKIGGVGYIFHELIEPNPAAE